MTAGATPLLKGETELFLRHDILLQTHKAAKGAKGKKKKRRSYATADAPKVSSGSHDTSLYQKLVSLRQILAKKAGIPAYIIFHDKTLKEMAAEKPVQDDQFRALSGVGESKLARYGAAFMDVIRSENC